MSGRLASIGFEAAWPLLDQAAQMMGFTGFFEKFLTIVILLIAWGAVILAFFILAVQLFVTIIEFKLTSLAGFVLVPFALWNRTSFLAERAPQVPGTAVPDPSIPLGSPLDPNLASTPTSRNRHDPYRAPRFDVHARRLRRAGRTGVRHIPARHACAGPGARSHRRGAEAFATRPRP